MKPDYYNPIHDKDFCNQNTMQKKCDNYMVLLEKLEKAEIALKYYENAEWEAQPNKPEHYVPGVLSDKGNTAKIALKLLKSAEAA